MPIYEYQCTSCHRTFDLMQKVNEAPQTQCQYCLKDTAVRLVSAAAFQLKGTGWYVTDFKDKKKPEKKAENKVEETSSSTPSSEKKSTASDN